MSKIIKYEDRPLFQYYISSPKKLASLHELSLKDRIRFAESGISKEELTLIKKMLHLDYDRLSNLLHITNRSMHLKKGNDVFNLSVSDRIMALLELYSFGYEIMGGHADFHEWMLQPAEKFLEKSPLDVISTHSGLLAVREALTNIQFGHF